MEENTTAVDSTAKTTENNDAKDETSKTNLVNTSNEEFYAKLDGMLAKRIDGVTKSILKDNGMEDAEIKDFIAKYKARNEENKKASATEIETLRQENEQLKKSIFDASVLSEVNSLAGELGFNKKYIPQIMKLMDMSEVNKNGKVNTEKLKTSIEKVLEDCEVFKISEEEPKKVNGFTNIGGNKDTEENTDSLAKIRKAMGLK
jgi:hypothetical protein